MPFNLEKQYQEYLYPESVGVFEGTGAGNRAGNGAGTGTAATAHRRQQKKALPKNVIKILLLNKPSKLNKRLLKFFNDNLELLNKRKAFFKWITVYESEIAEYEEQNITEFPVMISQRETIYGVNKIINALENIIYNRETFVKNEGDVVRDYFIKNIDPTDAGDDDYDENDAFSNSVHEKMTAMMKSRSMAGQHSPKTTNPEVYDRAARESKAGSRRNNIEELMNEKMEVSPDLLKPSEIARATSRNANDDDALLARFLEERLGDD